MIVSGNIVDVVNEDIYSGSIIIKNGKILEIHRKNIQYDNYLIPGFIDSHVHIESSMLTPSEFARIAVTHGTVAVVTDPHEIANVLGVEGVKFMINNGHESPMKFFFSAPSCVPATPFETSGAKLEHTEIEDLLKMDEVKYLGEFMNYPGVINRDPDVMKKIEIARRYNKKIDGHVPFVAGDDLKKYISAGISTDHECTTAQEAIEKIALGMKILIREGSACRDFDSLISIADKHFDDCMFCCDDLHPDELVKRHINLLVKMAVDSGLDIMKVLKMACLNPVKHYDLDVGLLQKGDDADFLIVDDLKQFNIISTYIKGKKVSENGKVILPRVNPETPNNFKCSIFSPEDFQLPVKDKKIKIIEATDGEVTTESSNAFARHQTGCSVSDVDRDILKIVVVNRYSDSKPAIGFIRGFGLKNGAIASSVAHDSHNIIALGTNDDLLAKAVNEIIKNKGGICAVDGNKVEILPLPIAGIISNLNYSEVAEKYKKIEQKAKDLGSKLSSTFMTLSFMALLVIPKLKISDKGLFDGTSFKFTDLWETS